MAWTSLIRLAPAALKLFKAAKKGKKIKRPKGSVVKEEVSHLTDDQKAFIDRHKGKKQGEGGDWQSKKSFDGTVQSGQESHHFTNVSQSLSFKFLAINLSVLISLFRSSISFNNSDSFILFYFI